MYYQCFIIVMNTTKSANFTKEQATLVKILWSMSKAYHEVIIHETGLIESIMAVKQQ